MSKKARPVLTWQMITDELLWRFNRNLNWDRITSNWTRAQHRAEAKRKRYLASRWAALRRKRHIDNDELLRLYRADRYVPGSGPMKKL